MIRGVFSAVLTGTYSRIITIVRARLKRDGTRAETRFGLSANLLPTWKGPPASCAHKMRGGVEPQDLAK